MLEGTRSTPSMSFKMPLSSGERLPLSTTTCIRSEMVVFRSSGFFMPRLTVRLLWGSVSTSSTFFPCCASPTPKLTVVVVLPTPPFWLATATTLHLFMGFRLLSLDIVIAACGKTDGYVKWASGPPGAYCPSSMRSARTSSMPASKMKSSLSARNSSMNICARAGYFWQSVKSSDGAISTRA